MIRKIYHPLEHPWNYGEPLYEYDEESLSYNLQKNLCKCCVNFYKVENPIEIEKDSLDEMCNNSTGMCTICYKKTNGKDFQSQDTQEFIEQEIIK